MVGIHSTVEKRPKKILDPTVETTRGFGAEGSFSVWLPTHYQWWVGKE